MLPFKNKNYFTLDNLSKYGHITLKFVGRYFYLDVIKFSKNRAVLVQKLCGEKKLSKSVFSYFKTKKKVPMAIKLEGGGGWGAKALVAWPLVDELFFCGFPYSYNEFKKVYEH